jgi:hypothetical protein
MKNPPVAPASLKNPGQSSPVMHISLCQTNMEKKDLTYMTDRKGGQNLKDQEGYIFNF